MNLLDLSRWQFAITVMFHMTFPAITVGLSIMLSVIYGLYWRTGKAVYLQMFRFWRRIFAVGFAIGVVAGAVITFQFGLNWGVYGTRTGPIIVPNSWMQTPAGYTIVNGRFEPTDWLQVIFNPSFLWRWPHMVLAVLISAAFFVAGIAAWYLIKRRAQAFARRSLSIGLGVAAVLLPVQIFVGDSVAGQYVIPDQPAKAAALEGNWQGGNTGWNFFVIPDQQAERNIVQLSAPWLGSAFGKDLSGQTANPSILSTPAADRPQVAATFWGFRFMFYGSLFMFAAVFMATVLRFRNRLWTSHRFHKYVLWTTPLAIVAILAGWVLAETGRQPWVVYGQLRTADAVSQLAPGEVLFSFIVFCALYLLMLVTYIAYIVHTMRIGPERDAVRQDQPAHDGELADRADSRAVSQA